MYLQTLIPLLLPPCLLLPGKAVLFLWLARKAHWLTHRCRFDNHLQGVVVPHIKSVLRNCADDFFQDYRQVFILFCRQARPNDGINPSTLLLDSTFHFFLTLVDFFGNLKTILQIAHILYLLIKSTSLRANFQHVLRVYASVLDPKTATYPLPYMADGC